ncbi:MAG: hypothetical protein JW864_06485 [Spirochaetes bacterium]|nr:hypothetical protein [Spirochaetota bacterium]
MKIKNHFIMLLLAGVAWGAFYLTGLLSNYFTDWSAGEKMLITWIAFFSILPFICIMVNIFLEGDHVKKSIWLAFYASVCLFVFDFIVVGLIEGKGIGFLISHWYLTAGYIEAWAVMPLTGYAMKKFEDRMTKAK